MFGKETGNVVGGIIEDSLNGSDINATGKRCDPGSEPLQGRREVIARGERYARAVLDHRQNGPSGVERLATDGRE
jgi:hypothetical protein